ncbi:bifunctional hydroxymethylpyrimidine kinase/phosphomethylpyrimidine kinase [Azohydromonas caseinilytica]|uniref:hydroxymethylpyrimidine kinase n=1 Tax=Azohydromonas caseinilytica TaxID=2728836 RepID=A0A848F104_9BURK|nr:bifunctional hydroxymethylpyrimidine kinase/phosphomethylpyrimidine kinase [Azohydromonas caseinilytica]NML13747.1 phosphomethylpyrimidine kinase [Azohydromonas caseinilytica]
MDSKRPVVWSIAGTDSGGGAGLSADQRMADAFNVHLCPVVAAVTAQSSVAVTRIEPLAPELIEAQLLALEHDMPPRAVKTGLLGGMAQIETVARWVDRLRARGPVALVVDPVLGASTGAGFADAATLQAYRELLLPRATVITPNRREAVALLGEGNAASAAAAPALARALQQRLGARGVCLTGGDSAQDGTLALDWIDTPQAQGWLALPRQATPHTHGTGCSFATALAGALALGFVPADAAVLAKMATAQALRQGHAAGQGAGPVRAAPGFGLEPSLLPRMSWGEVPDFGPDAPRAATPRPLDLYAIVDSAARVQQALAAGVGTLQLRIKTPAQPDAAWHERLAQEIRAGVAACRAVGAELFINDHWRLARELGAEAVHLGQEDLMALGEEGRRALRESGLSLGISTHSLWELCRAATLAPRYLACGPVWPTLTKAMPWRPQGLDNLAWWCAMAPAPVVAIGGMLEAAQFQQAARCGADGLCAVRVLGDDPGRTVPALQQALRQGRAAPALAAPALPHPSLAFDG